MFLMKLCCLVAFANIGSFNLLKILMAHTITPVVNGPCRWVLLRTSNNVGRNLH